MVGPGEMAPEFDGTTHTGARLTLSALRGHAVVLYFYPKADTPGCTTESKALRDIYPQLQARGVEVVGVSVDSVDDQRAFAEKCQLPFPLVADLSQAIARSYGVLRANGSARRVTFFLDGEGRVREVVDAGAPAPHLERTRALYLDSAGSVSGA